MMFEQRFTKGDSGNGGLMRLAPVAWQGITHSIVWIQYKADTEVTFSRILGRISTVKRTSLRPFEDQCLGGLFYSPTRHPMQKLCFSVCCDSTVAT